MQYVCLENRVIIQFGKNTISIDVTIDGTDGEFYTIPKIVCGLYIGNTDVQMKQIFMSS